MYKRNDNDVMYYSDKMMQTVSIILLQYNIVISLDISYHSHNTIQKTCDIFKQGDKQICRNTDIMYKKIPPNYPLIYHLWNFCFCGFFNIMNLYLSANYPIQHKTSNYVFDYRLPSWFFISTSTVKSTLRDFHFGDSALSRQHD